MSMQVVNAAASGTIITVPAVVLANGISVATASQSVTVATDNALTLGLDEDKDAVAPGATLTYALTYGNRSTASVTGRRCRFRFRRGRRWSALPAAR